MRQSLYLPDLTLLSGGGWTSAWMIQLRPTLVAGMRPAWISLRTLPGSFPWMAHHSETDRNFGSDILGYLFPFLHWIAEIMSFIRPSAISREPSAIKKSLIATSLTRYGGWVSMGGAGFPAPGCYFSMSFAIRRSSVPTIKSTRAPMKVCRQSTGFLVGFFVARFRLLTRITSFLL